LRLTIRDDNHYVRREANQIGNELILRTAAGESPAKIVELPFVK
jgi:hypothetical protein